jgi:DNA-binding CsgD family transcriptional regulator
MAQALRARKKPSPPKAEIHLTARERQILNLCATGKSMAHVGRLVGLSREGVDYHVRKARRKLSARTLIFAVFKAQHLGLIKFRK